MPLGTATRTSPNKRFHEKNIYSFVHKLQIFVHFFAILYKTRTQNDQVLSSLKNEKDNGNFLYYHLETNAVIAYLASVCFNSHWDTEQIANFDGEM